MRQDQQKSMPARVNAFSLAQRLIIFAWSYPSDVFNDNQSGIDPFQMPTKRKLAQPDES
jgi:hypothetical protein